MFESVNSVNIHSMKQLMHDLDFGQQLVQAKLAKLNTSKSAAPDYIHPRVLKELQGAVRLPLSLTF